MTSTSRAWCTSPSSATTTSTSTRRSTSSWGSARASVTGVATACGWRSRAWTSIRAGSNSRLPDGDDGRRAMGETRLIYGFHAVTSRLRQNAASVGEIYIDPSRGGRRARELARAAEARGVRVIMLEGARLDGMTGHARHQGIAARVEAGMPARDLDSVLDGLDEPALLLVLDGVTDPHNLGACLRVADAMGAHAVIAPKDRAAGINATVSRVASGAAETIPYIAVTNLARSMRELKDRGIWLIGADEKAEQDLYAAKLQGAL